VAVADAPKALELQRPLPDDALRIVASGEKEDGPREDVEDVRTAIGALNLGSDLMPHCLLDHSMRKRRDLLGPCPEGRPEAVDGDRPASGRIKPLLLARVHALQEREEGHV
jgi:hypothetical protein